MAPFWWNVPETESIRTIRKISLVQVSEQSLTPSALFVVRRFFVMPVVNVIKDEDLSGSEARLKSL